MIIIIIVSLCTGRACYVCNGADSNELCNVNLEVCPMDADACENEVRMHGGKKQIFKRCKQGHACNNNNIQVCTASLRNR